MRNILSLSMATLATLIVVAFAAPPRIIQNHPIIPNGHLEAVRTLPITIPKGRMGAVTNRGRYNPGENEMGSPPLQDYRVKDIQALSYLNFAKFYTDLIKNKVRTDPDADINAYINDLNDAFDKARVPGTNDVDNAIYVVIMNYRSFGYLLESDPNRFRDFQQGMLDLYSPTLSANDFKDLRRIIMSIAKTYY